MNPYNTNLPPDLRALKEEIEGYARGYGLDFYETIFEVVDADDLNEIAAYGGFPTRYPHWSFGMSYEELRKGYDYGLSKIYEMVINNDPCYAYLMRCNHTVDQKLVMAHVYGHCDFFKNNAYFAHTNRKMMDEMANHGVAHPPLRGEVRRGRGRGVRRPLHVDRRPDRHALDRHPPPRGGVALRLHAGAEEDEDVKATRFKSKDYMDDYINPRAVLKAEEEERRKKTRTGGPQLPRAAGEGRAAVPDRARAAQGLAARRAVDRPRRGVLLRAAGADQDHQRRLGVSYWHSHHHDPEGAAAVRECIDYADHHSGTMAMLARPRSTPTSWASSCCATSSTAGTPASSARNTTSATTWTKRRNWDKKLGLGRQENLRGAPRSQRYYLHRHLPDAGILRASTRCSQLRLSRSRRGSTSSSRASSRKSSNGCCSA